MINKLQINAFHQIATCAYAALGEKLYDYEQICDPCAKPLFKKLWLVRGWLAALCNYNPDSPYCLTDQQVLDIIEATKKALCLCGNINSLPEVALCIPCISSGTPELTIDELTWTCLNDGTDDANACYTITVFNGSGSYEFIAYINDVEALRIPIPYTGGTGTYSTCIYVSGSPNEDTYLTLKLHDINKDVLSESSLLTITPCGSGGQSGSGSGGSGSSSNESIIIESLSFACLLPPKEKLGSINYNIIVNNGSKEYVLERFNGLLWQILGTFSTVTNSGNVTGNVDFAFENGTKQYRIRDVNTGVTSNTVSVTTTVCPYVESIHIDGMSYSCPGQMVHVDYTVENGGLSYNLQYFNPDDLTWTNVLIFAGPETGSASASNGFGRNDGSSYNFRLFDSNKYIFSNVFNLQTIIC